MNDIEEPLPLWVREEILSKVSNKDLARRALNHVRLVRKSDGTLWVVDNLSGTDDHALTLMVHTCLSYARRLLRGEGIDDS